MEQAQEDVSQNCRAVGATAAAAAMATPLFVLLINYSYVHVCKVCGDVYVRVQLLTFQGMQLCLCPSQYHLRVQGRRIHYGRYGHGRARSHIKY